MTRPMTPDSPPSDADDPTTGSAWPQPAQGQAQPSATRSGFNANRTLQVGLTVVALTALVVGLLMALYSVNSVIDIWFQYQWAPVARLVMGLAILAASVATLFWLARRRT